MNRFYTLILSQEIGFQTELLSCPVFVHLAHSASLAGSGSVFYSGRLEKRWQGVCSLESMPAALPEGLRLTIRLPVPQMDCRWMERLIGMALDQGSAGLYVNGRLAAQAGADDREPENRLEIDGQELVVVSDPLSAFQAQQSLQKEICLRHMRNGVYMADPNTAQISPLAEIGEGTLLLPNVQLCGATKVGKDCRIGPNAMLVDARIADRVKVNASQVFESSVDSETAVGPFAYIRPGCSVGKRAKIGDFVELKKTEVGDGTKLSHLTYIGDASLGKNINIGCGVVMVNYDGKAKHHSEIGDNAFIGCNVNLVSPVRVGAGAYVAAGSTITEDVPEDSLAIARVRQTVKPEWVSKRKGQGKL